MLEDVPPGSLDDRLRLTVLATSDLHCRVRPRVVSADAAGREGGFSALADMLQDLRRQNPDLLLFDNGDLLQGSALADRLAHEWRADRHGVHPVIGLMNALGFDAATPGNHDLDYGLDYALRAYGGAEFAVVSASVQRQTDTGDWRYVFPPWTVLERRIAGPDGRPRDVRVGVIGVMPGETAHWNRAALGPSIRTLPIRQAMAQALPDLLRQEPDVVVALCHAGIDGFDERMPDDDGAEAMARMPGIDVVIGGHTHECFPSDCPAEDRGEAGAPTPGTGSDPRGLLHGTPVVVPGAYGERLGMIELDLFAGEGRTLVREQPTSRLRRVVAPAPGTRPRGPALRRLERMQSVVERAGDRRLTRLAAPLSSTLALIGIDPGGRILGEALAAYAARSVEGTPLRHLPILAATAPIRSGGRAGPGNFVDLAAGDLPQHTIHEFYPFSDQAALITVSGKGAAAWLECAAQVFSHVAPGREPGPLIKASVPGYFLDTLWGLDYRIDPTRPPGERVSDIRWQGQPLDPGAQFLIATNAHRASGAGGFIAASGAHLSGILDAPVQDVLRDHLTGLGEVVPDTRPAWWLTGSDWRAGLHTATSAAAALPDLPHLTLSDGGPLPDGMRLVIVAPRIREEDPSATA
ncbi:bifunctional metallophosphatase/5'-nucleotidase [Wenxinia saemankumensis]|uniref:2',3'-cyclic-nucleotide 2'-phosphodiesterase / 3'-nucleotidase n=1 Tax=Wenxinia saemankumensis TaxID=1447782 RepID=A0A1M6DV78_9RHOB|nr:5'-nucleotidase C-terminal domain-containing protein [Wenxinia saemankumensis]SHI77053.1 2',3'-cyclic-nucleotide 2'-phosphodiesterase / 3'-nucleotidase [Wenxinia saemankumensis]